MLICNLLLDGNYLLHRNVFSLHKNNLLFGALDKSLEMSISNYRKWFPFANIYLVSDSREQSWRKKINVDYKATRKKDSDIDWDFVFHTYDEFKKSLKFKGIKVLESSSVEGDDWLSFLVNKSNLKGISTIIVTNDYDIKQLVNYSLDPLYINIISNEMMNRQKLFLPKNYQIFMNHINKLDNNDIFNLNDNDEFIRLLVSFTEKYEVHETNPIESLLIKVISGDQSDNISSVWSVTKNGRKRGIGEVGAKIVFNEYITEFGEPDLNDPDISENIADIICEKKKLSKTNITKIKENIESNFRLINLNMDNIPTDIKDKMEKRYVS